MGSPKGKEDAGRKAEVGGGPMTVSNSQAAKSKSYCIEKTEAKDKNEVEFHEIGKVKKGGKKVGKPLAILSNHIGEMTIEKEKEAKAMQWEETTAVGAKEKAKGKISKIKGLGKAIAGRDWATKDMSPLAMIFEATKGWKAKILARLVGIGKYWQD